MISTASPTISVFRKNKNKKRCGKRESPFFKRKSKSKDESTNFQLIDKPKEKLNLARQSKAISKIEQGSLLWTAIKKKTKKASWKVKR